MADTPQARGTGLELVGLSRRYGDLVALDDLSFSVEPGQVFGFVGPNGAGKTTTMRIALGVLSADSGEVRWRGSRVGDAERRTFGYMPEERGLYPKMRVRDQLVYFARLHGVAGSAAVKAADHWMSKLGIEDRAQDAVESLSLGNQQRVQLGVSLVHRPELLILDEPFSGLDPVGVDVLSEVLLGEARERSVPVVFSSHQLELVERLCDAVAIVKAGRLVATGGVEELRDSRGGRTWRIEVSDAPEGWWKSVDGVEPLDGARFALRDDVDPQDLLDAGRAAGRVDAFGHDRPTLAELFREVIADDSEEDR